MYMPVYVCIHRNGHVCRNQRISSGVIPQVPPTFLSETYLSDMELTK